MTDDCFGKEESGGKKIAQGVGVGSHPPDTVWTTKRRVGAEKVRVCGDRVCEETGEDCRQELVSLVSRAEMEDAKQERWRIENKKDGEQTARKEERKKDRGGMHTRTQHIGHVESSR